jgi:hypothetical protein
VDNFDQLLARRQALEDILSQGLFFDPLYKAFGDFEVDIGFKQRTADLAQSFVNIALSNSPLPAERAEYVVKAFAKSVKHR